MCLHIKSWAGLKIWELFMVGELFTVKYSRKFDFSLFGGQLVGCNIATVLLCFQWELHPKQQQQQIYQLLGPYTQNYEIGQHVLPVYFSNNQMYFSANQNVLLCQPSVFLCQPNNQSLWFVSCRAEDGWENRLRVQCVANLCTVQRMTLTFKIPSTPSLWNLTLASYNWNWNQQ